PEGLSLEICVGSDIDEEAWIDPEVKDLCEITDVEMEALKNPEEYTADDELLPNPAFDSSQPHMHYPPGILEKVMSVPDEVVWERFSETQPPVVNQAMES
ncbi:MAG: VOC family protein, partial [Acidimicrobiales bacterium]